jgi:SAM-dependent methyltransferase
VSDNRIIEGIPVPPPHLINRIFPINDSTDEGNQRSFVRSGAQSLEELESILKLGDIDLDSPIAVLDWGCGSGRVTLPLMLRHPNLRVTGVDVDEGAIAWLRSLDKPATFDVCGTSPPLNYADGSFDLCVNHSVLTHIDELDQCRWLSEIARVVKVDGYFVTSVHGMHAMMQNVAHLEAEGISAERWFKDWSLRQFVWVPDDSFTGSTHGPGYHTTFQDPATVEHFSDYLFEPIAFHFGGDLGLQDHLLFRRRSDAAAVLRRRAPRLSQTTPPSELTPSRNAESSSREGGISTEELTRVWSMAASNLATVGQQLGRIENVLWDLSNSSRGLPSDRATRKMKRMLRSSLQRAKGLVSTRT